MAKVRILNDGMYGDGESVNFPVIVEGVKFFGKMTGDLLGFHVKGSELKRVGFTSMDIYYSYFFALYFGECELIEEVKNER